MKVRVLFITVALLFANLCAISADDEFQEFDEFEQVDTAGSEFVSADEFESFEQVSTGEECSESCSGEGCSGEKGKANTNWVYGILLFTIVAGIFVRFKSLRSLRGLFLLSSLVILGFYRGACPCPIMSFQNGILALFGMEMQWHKLLWFVGLIPITYLLGKVWCGWICHLGALQEFLFVPGKVKILQSAKAQKIMRYTRMALLVILIAQLAITKTNLFKNIDPFKVAFNLYSINITGWILLGLLLLSSVFIYRPFCKTVCPIGLVLGWISKIPGAAVIGVKGDCTGCVSCFRSCKINAITRDDKFSMLDNQECIACGECIQGCSKKTLQFVRKNKNHGDIVPCERA